MFSPIREGAAQYRANLHCHSTLSDGKLTPEQLKDAYRKEGYAILAITDHERPRSHSELSEKDFLLLTGYEAYMRPGTQCKYSLYQPELHCNLIAEEPDNVRYVCYEEPYCKYVKDPAEREAFEKVGTTGHREYTPAYINQFVREANENGYLCLYNHPVWSMEDEETILQYRGFVSMEMCNYSAHQTIGAEYNLALYNRLLRGGMRIACHGADDNHNEYPIGTPGSDSFGSYTMILADELTYPAVIRALKNGDFYASMGPRILSLSIADGKAQIRTSGAIAIRMFWNTLKKSEAVYGAADAPVCEATFSIPADAAFVQFSVTDAQGNHADTRGYFRDEFEKI